MPAPLIVPPPAPPAATKLEAFKPAAGAVFTFGYDKLGDVGLVTVDVRELRDVRGVAVRGVVVAVTQSQYRQGRSFIDADEVPELLRGIDALLAVKDNPTSFKNFEVHYTTRGECQFTAFGSSGGRTGYAVDAGPGVTATHALLDEGGMRKLRGFLEAAQAKLAAPAVTAR